MALEDRIYIFLCDKDTRDEVLEKLLVGTKWDEWQKEMKGVQIGSKVLVFDYTDTKYEFIGPFVVSDVRNGGSIDKGAWRGQFPAQARIEWAGEHKVVKLGGIGNTAEQGRLLRKNGYMPKAFVTGQDANVLERYFDFSIIPEPIKTTPAPQKVTSPPLPQPQRPIQPVQSRQRTQSSQIPQVFKTKQGFPAQSKAECRIANFLAELQIECYYDSEIPGGDGYRCDFYLRQHDIYVEYWGLEGNSDYDKNTENKRMVYRRLGYRLIELSPKDEYDLEERLRRALRGYGVIVEPIHGEPRSWLERFFRWLKSLFTS